MTAALPETAAQIRFAWTDLLHGLLSGLQEAHPIVLYQFVVLIRYPSWLAGGVVILSLVLNHMAVGIVITTSLLRSRRRLIRGCLDRMTDCTFTRYPASRFLGDVYEAVENAPFRRWLGKARMVKGRLDEMIRLHVVTAPRLIPQLSCYAAPSFVDSFIFITDPPAETRGLRRFFVLHEIGHSQMAAFVHPAVFRLWLWPQIALVLWIAATGTWNVETLPITIAYLSTVLLWWQEWHRRMARQRLLDELLADCFALTYLPAEDLARLATNRRLSALLDNDMDPAQNTIRLARLRENIDLVKNGDLPAAMERTFAEVTAPPWRVVIAGIVITATTGFLGAPPGPDAIPWMLALGGVLLVAWSLLVGVTVHGDIQISERLAKSAGDLGGPVIGARARESRAI